MNYTCWVRRAGLVSGLLLAGFGVRAHSLDDVVLLVQGNDVIARVSFMGSVRLVQQTPLASADFFQVQLESLGPDDTASKPTPPESRQLGATPNSPPFELVLESANATRRQSLNLRFKAPLVLQVRQGPNQRSLDLVVGSTVGATPGVQAAPDVETPALEMMAQARQALAGGRNQEAVDALNKLLLLPPNSTSQDAQELIGVAWERLGDMGRAKMEYELYLKLYSEGEGAQRVTQRLNSMGPSPVATQGPAVSAAAALAETKTAAARFNGNISQFYFGGKARSQSLVNLTTGIDQATLSRTTESALVTNVDLGGRYKTDSGDVRFALRGTGSKNLTTTSKNTSILNAAYADYRHTETGLGVRVGRQSPINGGLLGMFDGVSMTYPLRAGLRVDVMGGVPANPLLSAPSERLFAAMLEVDSLIQNVSGDVYVVSQSTQGITNRRSIGTEMRFTHERGSMYGLLDYDTLFRTINAVTLQGSLQGGAQTNYTVLVDSRKAPTLQMTNALISSGAVSLKTLLQLHSLDDVKNMALSTSAQARQFMFSVSRPVSEKWQLSGDVRYSDIGALPAVGNFEATPATGAQYGLSLQLTGSNLYSKRDISNVNLSILSTPFFKGVQVAYNNLTGWGGDSKLVLEPSIRFYTQKDNQGAKLSRLTPGVRVSYHISKSLNLMGEGMLEHSVTRGLTNSDTTDAVFFYAGFRYDLF